MRTPEEVARAAEEARAAVQGAWMHYSKREEAELDAVTGVIAAYRDEVLAEAAPLGAPGVPSAHGGEGVRVTLHVTEELSHSIDYAVPEEHLAAMRDDGVDLRDGQQVATWLADHLDADVDSLVEGAVECAVTERTLEGVSPAAGGTGMSESLRK